jgi:sulfhydrogenase subunit beta (sulfur reductase)
MCEKSVMAVVLEARQGLTALFGALVEAGYSLVGPTVREGAIVYDEVRGVEDLPAGVTDEQRPGSYRLQRRTDGALFGFAVGPHSWKRFLQVPRLRLWKAHLEGGGFRVDAEGEPPPRLALIGVRSCELHAIAVQDRVLAAGPRPDPDYAARRKNLFVIAVNCGEPGGTCFCVSMQTGPRASGGYDLVLTELLDDGRHDFLLEVGSEAGAAIAASIPHRPAAAADEEAAERVSEDAARRMGRSLDTEGIKQLLYSNLEHPRWDDVAARCLGCANCTMVCPTCFCTTVEDVTDLTGATAERVRLWDSCFNGDHSYIHGGAVRASIRARYRQWLTHKLASWIDQFGTSGCVGCGRCITWCPVGIDITEEVAAIRRRPAAGGGREAEG